MTTYNLLTFAALLDVANRSMEAHIHDGLDEAGRIVRDEAQRVLGTYEYGWPSLAQYTIDKKGADTPGLETEEMRDTLAYQVDGCTQVQIGSDMLRAVFFELGTPSQPPRSFLAGALTRKKDEVLHAIGGRVHGRLITP